MLVTGGAGFIGSNFIRMAIPRGHVVNLDKLTYAGVRETVKDLESREQYTFIQGDICDPHAVAKAMQGCDAVVHFAAESHVDRSLSDAAAFLHTNVLGTHVLLEEARKRDLPFLMVSTDEVYGQIHEGSFTEADALHPRNPYAASKAAADRLAYSYWASYGLPVVITRSSNNFGPWQFPEKVIPRFITNLLEGRKVPLYGDGKHVRDWLFVKDNCEAIMACLERGKAGEVYNIGGGNELPNIELTRLLLQELGKGEEWIEQVPDRPGHDRRYALHTGKAREELGWQPRHSFPVALRETVNWYRQNQWWWKPLIR